MLISPNLELPSERTKKSVAVDITVLINNAGLGDWNYTWDLSVDRLQDMIDLNVRALAVLSVLFTQDNKDNDRAAHQRCFRRRIRPCSPGSGGLRRDEVLRDCTHGEEIQLQTSTRQVGKMKAKVLVPGPIDTEFTAISLVGAKFPAYGTDGVKFHTPDEIAEFAHQLYVSDHAVGLVDTTDMSFHLSDSYRSNHTAKRSGEGPLSTAQLQARPISTQCTTGRWSSVPDSPRMSTSASGVGPRRENATYGSDQVGRTTDGVHDYGQIDRLLLSRREPRSHPRRCPYGPSGARRARGPR